MNLLIKPWSDQLLQHLQLVNRYEESSAETVWLHAWAMKFSEEYRRIQHYEHSEYLRTRI